MAEALKRSIAVVGIDIGKNSFHVVGLDACGAIVLRQKWSRGQVEARFANMPPCLIGMEACVRAHAMVRLDGGFMRRVAVSRSGDVQGRSTSCAGEGRHRPPGSPCSTPQWPSAGFRKWSHGAAFVAYEGWL
jgi:hypothetical protein